MESFRKENIIFSSEAKKTKDALKIISKVAKDLGYANNEKDLYKAFLAREKQGTTFMGDGFSIPHAISDSIVEVGIIIFNAKQGIRWINFENKYSIVNHAIALLIPKKDRTSKHMDVLSKTAQKLMDKVVQDALESYDPQKILKAFK